MFATVFLGVLNPETGRLDYVNAGHEPPILARQTGVTSSLNPTGPAAGLRLGIAFHHETLFMEPGDILFGYTDGVLDARSPDGKAFTRNRIQALMEKQPESATRLIQTVENKLHSHMDGESQFDDITMIAIRRKT